MTCYAMSRCSIDLKREQRHVPSLGSVAKAQNPIFIHTGGTNDIAKVAEDGDLGCPRSQVLLLH